MFCLSCRKVKYLNIKGSLLDEHTVKGLTKAGKEVGCLFIRHPSVLSVTPKLIIGEKQNSLLHKTSYNIYT